MSIQSMDRVVLIGSGGSGKSTLARQMGKELNLKVWHLDQLFWNPGWVATEKEQQRATQRELVAGEKWIIDGNYNATMDIRLREADTIIFLDLSRFVCLFRVLKRRWQYPKKTRPDMGEGCEERIDFAFIRWVWSYPDKHRPTILERLSTYSDEKNIIILRSTKEVKRFLASVEQKTY